jgi:uncharacterized membrane protein
MSHNGHRDREQQRERLERMRRQKVGRRNRILAGGAIAAVLVVACAAIYLALDMDHGTEYAPAENLSGDANSAVMTIPVSSVSSSAKFYTYSSGGTQVRFFTAIGSDGNVHVATDACDVCYGSHKGYRQTGNDMTCNNCGKTFAISHLGTKNTSGGCWPSYLPMKIDGGSIVIQKSDLDGKAYMFR